MIMFWLNFNLPYPHHARPPQRATSHLVVSRGLFFVPFKSSSDAAALIGVVL